MDIKRTARTSVIEQSPVQLLELFSILMGGYKRFVAGCIVLVKSFANPLPDCRLQTVTLRPQIDPKI